MELAVNIGIDDALDLARAAEELGYRTVLASDNFRSDAITVLSYVAAHTERIGLLPGVLQLPARSPAATATAAAALHVLSKGRFAIGLGVSNPDVSEGWHGVGFDQPVSRLREYTTILRSALAGEQVRFQGRHHRLPYGERDKAPLQLAMAPGAGRVPLYIGASSPRSLRLTGAVADGWIGAFTSVADVADAVAEIRSGRTAAGADGAFDVLPCMATYIDDGVENAADALRPHYARLLGVGDVETNFYCRLLRQGGYADRAEEIHDRLHHGDHDGAAAAVPLEFVDDTALIGPGRRVARRMDDYAAAGATCLGIMITAARATTQERIRQLGEAKRARALMRSDQGADSIRTCG
ncbi:LLM class flavin-dependent oxidoreductase [Streptomyces sp. NPDC058773]|uniref:LLM class flavin-dependent oxidoreductase n=1 Tax=Streptomyces sp. NPDC058773 TaxID=3346632 RepID=UPI0036B404AE